MDSLLARQLRKHLPSVDPNEPQWRAFLQAVEGAYVDLRNDRMFVEHTLETTSKELTEANETIRLDAENKLAAMSRYYRQTLELQQGMIQCVRLTPRGFEYTLCRGQLLHRLNLTPEKVEGRLVDDVIPSKDRMIELNAAYARAWSGEEFTTPYTSSNGLDLFILMRPRFEKGEVCEIIASWVEITALKETERALIAAKESAEAADRAKTEFLGVMSHEIRTPLNAVLGFSDLLMNSPLTAEQRGWLTRVSNSSESLLGLLNDILDYSRLEAGQGDLHPEVTSLPVLLDEIVAAFQPVVRGHGVELILETSANLPADAKLDRQHLHRVLMNLVGNACKFTHEGTVHFRVTALPDPARPGTGLLAFAIVDTGIGIPDDRRDRLFKPFSQVDSSNTRNYGGTGLGLAIADRLVRILGGQIKVQSVLGQGSTFSFEIPAEFTCPAEPAADSHAAAEGGAEATAELRILVAEDHPRNRELIGLMLDSRGFHADFAANGRLAVEAAVAQSYDLVVLDLQMPEMDGCTACREIVAGLDPWRRPKIIGMSDNESQDELRRCQEVGMETVLVKPLNFTALFAVVSRLVGARAGGIRTS